MYTQLQSSKVVVFNKSRSSLYNNITTFDFYLQLIITVKPNTTCNLLYCVTVASPKNIAIMKNINGILNVFIFQNINQKKKKIHPKKNQIFIYLKHQLKKKK